MQPKSPSLDAELATAAALRPESPLAGLLPSGGSPFLPFGYLTVQRTPIGGESALFHNVGGLTLQLLKYEVLHST